MTLSDLESEPAHTHSPRPAPSPRQVAAVVAGNALEFYDFVTYAFFAVQIGRTFFPSTDPLTSLLGSLAAFGAGFLTRPLGAWVIGRFADRAGRKPAMLLSFGLMGTAMLGIALTPSHAAIGIFAPLLVILWRLLQGFALGGEVGPSTAFLVEAAPAHRRGFFVSLQYVGQEMASFTAGVVGVVLATLLSAAALDAWGWRVAFLIGGAIIPLGIVLRRSLVETLHIGDADDLPQRADLVSYRRVIALAFVILAGGTTVGYVINYLTSYAQASLHLPANVSFGATVASGGAGIIFCLLGGVLSDRLGRKPMMIVPWILLLVTAVPAFWFMDHFRTPAALYAAAFTLSALSGLATTSNLVAVTESLPRRARAGALSLVYALAISAFGGGAQFFAAWLTRATGSEIAPGWYMMGAVAAGLIAMLLMDESAPAKVSAERKPLTGLAAEPVA